MVPYGRGNAHGGFLRLSHRREQFLPHRSGQVHAFREGCTLDGAMLKVSSDFVHGEPGTENLFMKYRVHQMGIPYYTITDERALRNLADMLEAIRLDVQLYSNEVMHKVMLQSYQS